jgi:hypothetical protein
MDRDFSERLNSVSRSLNDDGALRRELVEMLVPQDLCGAESVTHDFCDWKQWSQFSQWMN